MKKIVLIVLFGLVLLGTLIVLLPRGDAAITYSPSTKRITVTTSYPTNFHEWAYNEDKNGTLYMDTRTRTAVDTAYDAFTYNLRSADYKVLGGSAGDLWINVSAFTQLTTVNVLLNGTDRAGAWQTSNITITATGNYTVNEIYLTMNRSKITVFTASGGSPSITYNVVQGQWGAIGKDFGEKREYFLREVYFMLSSGVHIGDDNFTAVFNNTATTSTGFYTMQAVSGGPSINFGTRTVNGTTRYTWSIVSEDVAAKTFFRILAGSGVKYVNLSGGLLRSKANYYSIIYLGGVGATMNVYDCIFDNVYLDYVYTCNINRLTVSRGLSGLGYLYFPTVNDVKITDVSYAIRGIGNKIDITNATIIGCPYLVYFAPASSGTFKLKNFQSNTWTVYFQYGYPGIEDEIIWREYGCRIKTVNDTSSENISGVNIKIYEKNQSVSVWSLKHNYTTDSYGCIPYTWLNRSNWKYVHGGNFTEQCDNISVRFVLSKSGYQTLNFTQMLEKETLWTIPMSSFSDYPNDDSPWIRINFSGNHADNGSHFWLPPYECCTPDYFGVIGYYINGSKQKEDWMDIEVWATDTDGVSKVYVNWLDKLDWADSGTWTKRFYDMVQVPGTDTWVFNTSGNITTHSGHWYSYDIEAYDIYGRSSIVVWEKVDYPSLQWFSNDTNPPSPPSYTTHRYNGTAYDRYYVSLNNTPSYNLSYKPFYLFKFFGTTPYDGDRYDNLPHNQGMWGDDEAGYLSNIIPDDTVNICKASEPGWENQFPGDQFRGVTYWWNDAECLQDTKINRTYYHTWWYSQSGVDIMGFIVDNSTGFPGEPPTLYEPDESFSDVVDAISNISYDGKTYSLNTGFIEKTPSKQWGMSDNNIYELFFSVGVYHGYSLTGKPWVVSNQSFKSFVIFNLPDNTTLMGLYSDADSLDDYDELFVYGTSPFLSDTDADGVTDGIEIANGYDPNDWTDPYPPNPPILYENIVNATGTHTSIWNGLFYNVSANYIGVTTPLHQRQHIVNATGTHTYLLNGTGYWDWANYTGNTTPVSLHSAPIFAFGTLTDTLRGIGGWDVYANYTSALGASENIVNATGTHQYRWNSSTNKWWVWANYTGTGGGAPTPIHLFQNFVNATGTHVYALNSTGYQVYANVTGNLSAIVNVTRWLPLNMGLSGNTVMFASLSCMAMCMMVLGARRRRKQKL